MRVKPMLTAIVASNGFTAFINPATLLASENSVAAHQIREGLSNSNDILTISLSVGLILISISLIISISVSFYLYRWRKILLSNPTMLVPEAFGEKLRSFEETLQNLINWSNKNAHGYASWSEEITSSIRNMTDTFMAFQSSIDAKDKELQRFKLGYDMQIFRKYLYRFVRIHQTMTFIDSDKTYGEDDFKLVKRLLEDAMDECGVEEFVPEVGSDAREVEGLAENPRTRPPEKGQRDFEIVEVREVGYRCRTPNGGFEIIVPSKVVIALNQQGA